MNRRISSSKAGVFVFLVWAGMFTCASLPLGAAATGVGGAFVQRPLTFERDIRPIFKHYCLHCHGEDDKVKGGLDLRLRRFLVEPHGKNGDSALIPGKPAESELLSLVKDGEMPPKGKKSNAAEISLIERWITEGAITSRPEPEKVPEVCTTEEEREFWAFQPLLKPTVASARSASELANPIDKFIAAALDAKSLRMNPEASKRILVRRVAFDLTGLPPSLEQLAEFEADRAPDAYERMVERFLASPHYGERWGRHWLDVAGYADSDGYGDADPVRPRAYHFRDYVIRAINSDKLLDLFTREQLAGDEIVTGPLKNMTPDTVDKLAATGFLRMVPDGTAAAAKSDQVVARNDVITETLLFLRGEAQNRYLKFLEKINLQHLVEHPGESDLEARIASYAPAGKLQTSAKEVLDISGESAATKKLYGIDNPATAEFGTRCLIARRLVERGVRFVQLFTGNQTWDHHRGIIKGLPEACAYVDQGAAALVIDLKQRRLLDSIIVHWGGEMGRLPVIQFDAGRDKIGRDHNTYGFSVWVAGGGFKAGLTFGETDEFAHKAVKDIVTHHDYHATLLHLFGLDHTKVTYERNGVPMSLTNNKGGRVVTEILA